MVLKVRNLLDWSLWPEGRMLPLPKDKGRTVRLEVICQTATEFRVFTEEEIVEEDAKGQLLAVLPHGGQEIIEFFADGNVLISASSDGEVMMYCSENDQWWVEFEGEVSFTKPYERPLVDPAMQRLKLVMMQNMQAMEARIQAGILRQRAVEPPKVTVVEGKPVVEDDKSAAGGGAEPPGGQEQGAGPEVQPQAESGGSRVRAPAAGQGG